MRALLINSNISEGPVYALFYFGAVLNVALLDLAAAVVSLLTSCNIQTPSKKTNEVKKKCKLLFIKFYYFFDFLKAS